MIVKESSLIIQNVITIEEEVLHEDWHLPLYSLRNALVAEGIYYNSPVMFKVENIKGNPDMGKYTYHIGLNTEIDSTEDLPFKQEEVLIIGPAIYVRCTESEELDEAYSLLEQYAEKNNLILEPQFFHVLIDVFDDAIIDIYAQVKDGELVEWS